MSAPIATVSTESSTQVENIITAMLAPIPGSNPAGENLQYAGIYDEIREARRADENLEQGDWKYDLKSSDWYQVTELAREALTTRTKDLQIAVWFAEAYVKQAGFEGLLNSLRLVSGLLENYWDNLYPEIDEGDLEARANTLSWFDRQIAMALREAPVCRSLTGAAYSYLNFEQSKEFDIPESLDDLGSNELKQINELKERAKKEGKITSEQWRIAKSSTKRAFYEDLFKLIDNCWHEFQRLDRIMDEKFANQTPGLGALKKSLDEVKNFIEKIVKEKRISEPDPATPAASTVENPTSNNPVNEAEPIRTVTVMSSGPIHTRAEAFKRLREVADYFHEQEPQSPVIYLIERAIKWGQMPLESWLEDVVKSSDVLEQLRETLGLKTVLGESNKE